MTYMKKRLGEEPTPLEIERGKAFALWLQAACERRGVNITALAAMMERSKTGLYLLYNGGLDKQTNKIRQPDEETIKLIAEKTGADEDSGRLAAGYPAKGVKAVRPVSPAISSLSPVAQRALETLLEAVRPDDPLLRVGKPVDLTPLAMTPLTTARAVAETTGGYSHEDGVGRVEDIMPGNIRGIEVVGNCMEPFYKDGDVVLVAEGFAPTSGDAVVAITADDAIMCKVYRESKNKPFLETASGEVAAEPGTFRIIGIVAGFYRRARRLGSFPVPGTTSQRSSPRIGLKRPLCEGARLFLRGTHCTVLSQEIRGSNPLRAIPLPLRKCVF